MTITLLITSAITIAMLGYYAENACQLYVESGLIKCFVALVITFMVIAFAGIALPRMQILAQDISYALAIPMLVLAVLDLFIYRIGFVILYAEKFFRRRD